ncbi:hypothetical protein [[Mycobacterium] burgundiense]|uniref:DUF4352 domain-containing protein n=1 Tax=[Mycobacterium] burgundiense TaxID=3064286 RepID=A0ABM9M2S4_9MYCO|nr:hypothetical protein [Mycolicibacterium sp. MU0053]CAJ1509142.1 hypothetical protein MU0053_004085 [Mycolicibacterium sp. MU0053]
MSQPAEPRKRLWQRMTLARWRKTGVVALLAVTAAFGGLREADHVTPVALESRYDAGPLAITGHSVEVASGVPWLRIDLAPECRFVVLDATITNNADGAAPIAEQRFLSGNADDCRDFGAPAPTDAVLLANLPNRYAGSFRVRDGQTVPIAEPGFTERFRLAWVVSAADLAGVSDLKFDFRNMTRGYSTFRISRQWFADEDRYGELTVANPVTA